MYKKILKFLGLFGVYLIMGAGRVWADVPSVNGYRRPIEQPAPILKTGDVYSVAIMGVGMVIISLLAFLWLLKIREKDIDGI